MSNRTPPRRLGTLARVVAQFVIVFPSLVVTACVANDDPPAATTPADPRPVHATGTRIVDGVGRTVFFRGVNARIEGIFDVTFDDGRKALEPIPSFSGLDATAMRDWGFDALRLPVNWSAIEPTETGGFSEGYLDRVRAVVQKCDAAGVRVLIDFHQDAYSKEIGEDGAPLWAIFPAPTKLLEGPLDDLGDRRQSKQVLDAFAGFFGDPDSPDDPAEGARLRDRFTAMVKHVAAAFKDEPAVLGFEIYNEPIGTEGGIRRLHKQAAEAIAAAAPGKLILFEPNSARNLVDSAPDGDGSLGENTVYAPHVYTLSFTGTDAQREAMTKETLQPSNEAARSEADTWKAPLVITEWGYGPTAPHALDYYVWQSELQDASMASSFFWVWKEQSQGSWGCYDYDANTGAWSDRTAIKKALARVRPAAVSGVPSSYEFDAKTGVFTLDVKTDAAVTAPHLIAIAPVLGNPLTITCDGAQVQATPDKYNVVELTCGVGDGKNHTITLSVTPAITP